jgi:AcrR family transcriptional regulator
LLATADRLFYAEGIHAIGAERLMSGANVARTTYRHFDGKDALVTAYIKAQEHEIRDCCQAATQVTSDPAELLRAVAIGIAQMVYGPAFRDDVAARSSSS